MTEYIKKEDAKERTNQLYHGDEVEAWLESLPTIDIVHCKDCKYSRFYALDSNEEPQRWCKAVIVKAVDDDDYCSFGG